MHILGISCFYHDAAACLLRDGIPVAAAAEERFTRRKHTSDFPIEAITYCLKEAGISTNDIDYVVFYEKPLVKFERILVSSLATFPRSYRAFVQAIPLWLKERLRIEKLIRKKMDYKGEILYGEHHLSHAGAAFLVSPFEEAVILTVDGVGEWGTTTFGLGRGTDIRIDGEIRFPHSLGLYYSALTAYLGFKVNDAEWKVMGLAPYGKPKYVDRFRKLLVMADDGGFRLDLDYFAHHYSAKQMFNHRYEELMGGPKRVPESDITDFHRDIACSGQAFLVDVLVEIAQKLHARYKVDNLCIAGGVGLNSVANWHILKKTPFKEIFIQPAAGDDGAALGVACYVHNTVLGNPRKYVMNDAYLGPAYADHEIRQVLDANGAKYERLEMPDMIHRVAGLLADEKIIGWFQGRMEFGPRALGSRSILASPIKAEMKDIINAKVKFRERFRPFAPSVCREDAPEYFDIDRDAPFMLLIPDVKPEKRHLLQAVTHVDGTARLQTIRREDNPDYYDLIREFGTLTGVPVILNTSFNIRGEPIVCTPADGFRCFMKTGIDYLAIGNYLIGYKGQTSTAPA